MEGAGKMLEEMMPRWVPTENVNGFEICPGLYRDEGATAFQSAVNFTVHSKGAVTCELLLFHRKEPEPYAVIPFPENCRIGDVFSMMVFGLDIEEFEYAYRLDGPWKPKEGLLFDKKHILLDPYAKAVTGQSVWGKALNTGGYRARVVRNNFFWGSEKPDKIPMEKLIIYEMHVRGFTKMDKSVRHPGTFAGIKEKIPYLKTLGINAVELMPIFEFDELQGSREVDGKKLIDYWGYNTVSFFAPNTSYAASTEYNREGVELKELIRELHDNQIEVILDVVFNHTAEGNECGPFISFKGFDNQIYYMLTPDGKYYNFSGCGNTVNCNHPVVIKMIQDCLRYWVAEYRVDGFRFDLASILGRNEDGSPMENPPLVKNLAYDSLLADTKLIAEAWDAGGLYQVGSFPAFRRWSEWNGRYRDDVREYLKGGLWAAGAALQRIAGSPDIYDTRIRGKHASVNFLTCHDGHGIKVFAADCHICRVILDRIVELIPRKAHSSDNIRCSVSLREHIFYFKTAVDIPLGNIICAHRSLVFIGKELFRFTLTGYLHYLERHARLDAFMYEIGHDAVSCSDNIGNGAGAVIYKVFCVAEPDIGTVGKSGYLEHIGEILGL